MTWRRRRQLNQILASLWLVPVASMLLGVVAARFTAWIDGQAGWVADLPAGAVHVVMVTLAGAMFSLIVFVSSAMLVTLQLASAQLTPRIIQLIFRWSVVRVALACFHFMFAFLLTAAMRIEDVVPRATTMVAGYGSMFSLGVFLLLVQRIGSAVRPGIAISTVARLGRRIIDEVYPNRMNGAHEGLADPANAAPAPPSMLPDILSRQSGYVLAFDVASLRRYAERAECVIEVLPQVGDFIARGQPLFRLVGARAAPAQDELLDLVLLGPERTLEQDPTFALRVIVDIASKSLSPAINDPTTAVHAIDQLHVLLRMVGVRNLEDERTRDARGRVRVVLRTPNWDHFVLLAVTEIRQFGCKSIQVVRRLRAMLEDLIHTLPSPRIDLLRRELTLLNASAERDFADLEDQAMARVGDSQGVGGYPTPHNGEEGAVRRERNRRATRKRK